MTELQATEKVLTSLEVSEMVGREHKNVMRDIEKIKGDLNALKIEAISYFKELTYKDKLNRNKPMFLLTKKGCELYGNRMTGIDGTAFAVKYIERFNEMEEKQQQQQQPKLPTTYKEALLALVEAELLSANCEIVAHTFDSPKLRSEIFLLVPITNVYANWQKITFKITMYFAYTVFYIFNDRLSLYVNRTP